ncbi:hypothetical protein KPH14_006882 [Odynerus spinipes]|uniref:Uncharacterized protein n=1 Tax=Odynerus spinipes TaxID=1348599 RepID=A0AAD9RSM2_9HYME|nr:hypothetical protein KPH14_006882 [Odynerus spinipes]
MKSSAEIDLLKSYTVQGQKLAKAYLIYMSITGFMFLLQPFLVTITSISSNSTDVLSTIPFRVQYGVDPNKYYYEIVVHCYITVVAHMGILCSMNLIYILFIQHSCGLFAVIGYKLKRLGVEENLKTSLNIKKKNDTDYWTALECLRRHIQAIEFSEFVEGTFSTCLLCTMGVHVIGLAVAGFQILLHTDDFNELVRYICLCTSVVIQLFWECWQAQLLLDYSNVPYECAIESEWYNTSTRCKKILVLIMVRSLRPCKITAGKMITLSIETFSSVLRTSMSYFTVLQSAQ